MRPLSALCIRDIEHLCKHLGADPRELQRICDGIERCPRRYYREWSKTIKGKLRPICEPIGRLKELLVRLNALLQRLALPGNLHGGVKGRSPLSNARVHIGKPTILKSDVKKFFPSVSNRRIYEVFTVRCGCTPNVARILTRLTTLHGCLPQGSHTSTVLANLVAEPLALRLDRLAEMHNSAYTQFVDDVTLSGPHHLNRLEKTVKKIIVQEGLQVNEEKTEPVPASKEQVVTGVRVNNQLDVPSAKLTEVRKKLDEMASREAQGIEVAPDELASVEGKIRHIGSLNPGAAKVLWRRLRVLKRQGF